MGGGGGGDEKAKEPEGGRGSASDVRGRLKGRLRVWERASVRHVEACRRWDWFGN